MTQALGLGHSSENLFHLLSITTHDSLCAPIAVVAHHLFLIKSRLSFFFIEIFPGVIAKDSIQSGFVLRQLVSRKQPSYGHGRKEDPYIYALRLRKGLYGFPFYLGAEWVQENNSPRAVPWRCLANPLQFLVGFVISYINPIIRTNPILQRLCSCGFLFYKNQFVEWLIPYIGRNLG